MPARLRLADHLSAEELFARYRASEGSVARSHWQVLWMLSQGWRTEDIADAVGYSPTWIRKLAGRYNEGGEAAMGDLRRHNRGATPLLGSEEEAALRQALQTAPEEGDVWSGPLVAHWMGKHLGRRISRTRGWEALRRLGYTPQRPRPCHAGADPEAQASFPGRAAPDPRGRAAGTS